MSLETEDGIFTDLDIAVIHELAELAKTLPVRFPVMNLYSIIRFGGVVEVYGEDGGLVLAVSEKEWDRMTRIPIELKKSAPGIKWEPPIPRRYRDRWEVRRG